MSDLSNRGTHSCKITGARASMKRRRMNRESSCLAKLSTINCGGEYRRLLDIADGSTVVIGYVSKHPTTL